MGVVGALVLWTRGCLGKFNGREVGTFLEAAIVSGPSAGGLIDLLLASGVSARCVDDHLGPDYQHTPLVTAARAGRLDLVQRLVRAGADPFWSSPTGANVVSRIRPSRAPQDRLAETTGLAQVRAWLSDPVVRNEPLGADSRRQLRRASRARGGLAGAPAPSSLGSQS